MKYGLAAPTFGDEEIAAMHAVIDSGMYTMGERVRKFEEEFAKYNGARYAVMTNSGSSANLLMVAALFFRKDNPLKRGDEVIVPAVSWSTTFFPLQQYGLHVKFVDVDLHTLNMDVGALASAITDRTRLVMAVNLLGNPNDYDSVYDAIRDRGITLVEDNCESLGGSYMGRKLGTFGVMGSYSTFFSHHICTMEGGMVVTDDEELYHILLSIRSHGWTRHLPAVNRLVQTFSDPFHEKFRFILPGYNVRPTEIEGAIGSAQLPKLDGFVKMRRQNAQHFVNAFGFDERFTVQRETGNSSWFGLSIVINDPAIDRDGLVRKLADAGIESRPIESGNFTHKEAIGYFDYEVHGELKNADVIEDNGFFVGNQHLDIRDKIDYMKQVIG